MRVRHGEACAQRENGRPRDRRMIHADGSLVVMRGIVFHRGSVRLPATFAPACA
ncbi:hypothetical protein BURPS305_6340 [Burkholderia pseudomallei 305]|nr:hypothetical protein BURPS305_6340 [Burkholderia pseudomallei 305]